MIINGRLTALNVNQYGNEVELCLTVMTSDFRLIATTKDDNEVKSVIYHLPCDLPCDIELKLPDYKVIRHGNIDFRYNPNSGPEVVALPLLPPKNIVNWWTNELNCHVIATYDKNSDGEYSLRFIRNIPFDVNPDDFWRVAREAQEYLDSLS